MAGDAEAEQLRAAVSCALVLEKRGFRLDERESTKRSMKYRRGEGEIVIVNHEGQGWWDTGSTAKGDVFTLVQYLDPSLNFGQARRELRALVGLTPTYEPAERAPREKGESIPPQQRWLGQPAVEKGSRTWAYLTEQRGLTAEVVAAAAKTDQLRQGPYGSAWFAHRDRDHAVTGFEMRGPDFRSFCRDGDKSLFRLQLGQDQPTRLAVTEAPIDAMSLAVLEGMRKDTLYVATGGGIGPGTVAALEHELAGLARRPGAVLVAATDADSPGARYAARLAELAAAADVPARRLAPPAGHNDWNDVLREPADGQSAELPAAFLDELRARTPLPAMIGRFVRLERSGQQWKGNCPFHAERTPSFNVRDDHYHCFGCGAHGDAIQFVMQSRGASFMEAVEQLAFEVGLEVPKPSPAAPRSIHAGTVFQQKPAAGSAVPDDPRAAAAPAEPKAPAQRLAPSGHNDWSDELRAPAQARPAARLVEHAQGAQPGVIGMSDTMESLRHQRNLLAEALGKVLVTYGVIRADAALTGPELLLAAETALRAAAAGRTDAVAPQEGKARLTDRRPQPALPADPRPVLDVLLSGLRGPGPTNGGQPPAQTAETPMAGRLAAFEKRAQDERDGTTLRGAVRSGQAALDALQAFAEGAAVMRRIREAARSDPGGLPAVLTEMRGGGRYAELRQRFNGALEADYSLFLAYDGAAGALARYAADRGAAQDILGRRPDAGAVTTRLEQMDAAVAAAAAATPGRSDGRSMADELAGQAAGPLRRAVDAGKPPLTGSPAAASSASRSMSAG